MKKFFLFIITIQTIALVMPAISFAQNESKCEVVSLKIDPMSQVSADDPLLYPNFYTSLNNQPRVKFILTTKNCDEKIIKIALRGQDTALANVLLADGTWDWESVHSPISVKIPPSATAGTSTSIDIIFLAGTSVCRYESLYNYCGIQAYIVDEPSITFSEEQIERCGDIVTLTGGISEDAWCYFRYTIPEGYVTPGSSDEIIGANTGRSTEWKYVSNTGMPLVDENTQEYTGSGECWDETNQSYLPNCYEPISGLPLKDLEVGGDKLLDKIDENTTVGDYLNSLFALAIGVAGVLGVIMIVIYAYEYLTSSNPGGKIELRNKILQVLLGIVLLLGIYTILKTINPDLLRLDPFVPEAKEPNEGVTGGVTLKTIPMKSIGSGTLDVLDSTYFTVSAKLNEETKEVTFHIEALFRDGMTKPTQGLEVHIGTSETDTPLVFPLEDVGGATPDIIFFGLNQTKSLTSEQVPTTYYYKIIDKASGDQVKTSEETIASESCTPLEPTNQTPGTQQEASNKKFYNPKRSEADFIEWVGNCRQSVPALKPVQLTTTSGQPLSVDPCDPDNFVTVSNVFGGKSFQTHKNLKPAIERISQKWDLLSGADKYEIEEVGGNHCRWMTDKEGRVLSNHSYALSIDINPLKNPYLPNYKDPGLTRPRSDYTDMPQAFVQLWLDEGFGWGGNWTSKKDAMHFSKIKEEGGNAIVDAI